jgi:cytoskeletal protein CcmA (bactofilin family)
MFRTSRDRLPPSKESVDRVTSVLGEGISWQGKISGQGGVRIEGAFDGEIVIRGLVVIAEKGRVTCDNLRAESIIIAGSVKGDLTAQRVEISKTGRVWGKVVTSSFATDEGAFLKGEITMDDNVDLDLSSLSKGEGEEMSDTVGAEE